MTKEPIIIYDVDVAECEHLYTSNLPIGNDKTKCGLHQGIGKTCNDYPNCYFKQLKHKEQECNLILENLKNNFFSLTCVGKKVSFAYKGYDLDKLIADNDQLKAELKEFKDMAKQGLDNYKDVGGCWGCGISFSFDELLKSYKSLELSSQKQIDQLKAENKKLKELVKTRIEDLCDSCGASSMMPMPCKVYEQALQKIKDFFEYEFYGENIWVKQTILQTISEVIDD